MILLLMRIINDMNKKGYAILITSMVDKYLNRVFKFVGFSSKMSTYGFFVYSKNKTVAELISKAESWFFILGDTDVY